ncbi:MAG TPA: DUF1178 family protein [Acetobacteraceae bacterium]|jgi:hypothetical protein|nr:DUF1178 family protein [Acetobacteraceae bacterium]
MIHYQLHCAGGHDFDGWFRDSAAFDAQAKAGFVECPTCGGTEVSKRLMAPAIPKKGARRRQEVAPPAAEGSGAEATAKPAIPPASSGPGPGESPGGGMVSGPIPAQLVALLQRMRSEVERNCEYVGPKFAEAARRLHQQQQEGQVPESSNAPRGIYGEATDAEAEALREDGIEVARIPWVPRADG